MSLVKVKFVSLLCFELCYDTFVPCIISGILHRYTMLLCSPISGFVVNACYVTVKCHHFPCWLMGLAKGGGG